jgi:hypothetical protein
MLSGRYDKAIPLLEYVQTASPHDVDLQMRALAELSICASKRGDHVASKGYVARANALVERYPKTDRSKMLEAAFNAVKKSFPILGSSLSGSH